MKRKLSILFAATLFGGMALFNSDSVKASDGDIFVMTCSGDDDPCTLICPICGHKHPSSAKGKASHVKGVCEHCGENAW